MSRRVAELPGETRVLVRRGEGSDADLLIERRANEPAPLGSVFKLFVLLAVADAIDASELAWDDTLEVTESEKSLPSGQLQEEPAGTRVTVREAASQMIAISDNTATDLLIARIGRERVERAFASLDESGANVPWLTTKDFFTIGWGDPEFADRWQQGAEPERRRLLDQIAEGPLDVDAADVVRPAWLDGVDWFASAETVAAVHAALHARDDPELRGILSRNPGVGATFDRERLPYLAFKGGSAPGVLAGSWLGETTDGETVTVVITLAGDDPLAVAAAQRDLFSLGEDALRLAAE